MTIRCLVTCCLATALLLVAESTVWTTVVWSAPQAGCGCRDRIGGRGCGRCNDCIQCPQCAESFVPPAEEYCELVPVDGRLERECFSVDYKTICIPKVTPPWRQGCEPVCAEARSVKFLTTRKLECPACRFEWQVRQPPLPQFPDCPPGMLPGPGMPANPAVQPWPGNQPVPANPPAPPAQGALMPFGNHAATLSSTAGKPWPSVHQPPTQPAWSGSIGQGIPHSTVSQPWATPQTGRPHWLVPGNAPHSQSAEPPAPPTASIGDYFGQ